MSANEMTTKIEEDEFYNLLSLKMPNWEKIKEKMELKLLSY